MQACFASWPSVWRNNTKRIDDSLDAFGVHGVGGTWGAIATGIFATVSVNALGGNGLLYGNPAQLGVQLIAVGSSWGYSFVMTIIILKVIDKIMGLRVTPKEEEEGLDISQHGERAYSDLEAVPVRASTAFDSPRKIELIVQDSDRELIAELIRKKGSITLNVPDGKLITTQVMENAERLQTPS